MLVIDFLFRMWRESFGGKWCSQELPRLRSGASTQLGFDIPPRGSEHCQGWLQSLHPSK